MTRLSRKAATFLVLTVSLGCQGVGAYDIYFTSNDSGLRGEVLAEGYEGWLAARALSFAVGRAPLDVSADRPRVSDAEFRPVEVVRSSDSADARLFEIAALGTVANYCFDVLENLGDARRVVQQVILGNAVITNLVPVIDLDATDASGSPLTQTMNIQFDYTQIHVEQFRFLEDRSPDGSTEFCWDRSTNAACATTPSCSR
jgi:type VI protein secretion system component Hcp